MCAFVLSPVHAPWRLPTSPVHTCESPCLSLQRALQSISDVGVSIALSALAGGVQDCVIQSRWRDQAWRSAWRGDAASGVHMPAWGCCALHGLSLSLWVCGGAVGPGRRVAVGVLSTHALFIRRSSIMGG
jgi:hypothetical protein